MLGVPPHAEELLGKVIQKSKSERRPTCWKDCFTQVLGASAATKVQEATPETFSYRFVESGAEVGFPEFFNTGHKKWRDFLGPRRGRGKRLPSNAFFTCLQRTRHRLYGQPCRLRHARPHSRGHDTETHCRTGLFAETFHSQG